MEVIYNLQEILPTFVFDEECTSTIQENEKDVKSSSTNNMFSKLGNENPIHKVKILNTYPEIANSIRRTLTSYFDSCAFPDTTIKEISKTREMPYFADTYITPYVEQLLRSNNIIKDTYESCSIVPTIDIIKNTSKMKRETIIRHISMIPINLDPEEFLKCPEAFQFEMHVENTFQNDNIISVTSEDIQYHQEKDTSNEMLFDQMRPEIREIFPGSSILNTEMKQQLEEVMVGFLNTRNDLSEKNKSQEYFFKMLEKQFIHIMYLQPGEEIHVRMVPMVHSAYHNAAFGQFSHITMFHIEDPTKVNNQRQNILNYLNQEEQETAVNFAESDKLVQNSSESYHSIEKKDLLTNFELHDRQRFVYTRNDNVSEKHPNCHELHFQRSVCNSKNYSAEKCIKKSLKSIYQSIKFMVENLILYKSCSINHPLKSEKTPEQNIVVKSNLIQNKDTKEGEIFLYIILKFPEILESHAIQSKKVYVNLRATIDLLCQNILYELLIKNKNNDKNNDKNDDKNDDKNNDKNNDKNDNGNKNISPKYLLSDKKVCPLEYIGVNQPHPLRDYIETHFVVPYDQTFQMDSSNLKIDDKKKLNNYAIDILISYYKLCGNVVNRIIDNIK